MNTKIYLITVKETDNGEKASVIDFKNDEDVIKIKTLSKEDTNTLTFILDSTKKGEK